MGRHVGQSHQQKAMVKLDCFALDGLRYVRYIDNQSGRAANWMANRATVLAPALTLTCRHHVTLSGESTASRDRCLLYDDDDDDDDVSG